MARGGARAVALLALLTIGACLAVCGIVAIHLQNVQISTGGLTEASATMGSCALGTTSTINNLCLYAYVGAGVGAGLALITALVAFISCKSCGWAHIFDFVIGIIGTAWMAAFGILFVITSNMEQNKNLGSSSASNWRMATWICFFIGAGLLAILTLLSGVLMCMACCCRRPAKEKPLAADLEHAGKPTEPYPAPSDTAYGAADQYPHTTTTTTTAPTQQYAAV